MSPERWQRIESLYHDAQERPALERAAWLAQACADDEALRGEVEQLLAADESASGFMEAPAWQVEARKLAAEKPAESPEDSLEGQQFGHYKILSKLGAGGMGEVYLAHDLALERQVAIKVLPAAFTRDAERVQRFVREAKAASALNHPNIITIHEIGQASLSEGATQYPTQFIVTELVEGQTLRQRLRHGPLPRALALDLMAQVAAALAAAHKAGIVHRDIKPENVMVRPDGLVKVLDFGLAKLTEKRSLMGGEVDSEAPTMQQAISMPGTAPGAVMGTLNYMSPEQVRGESVDARSDLFSVGIVLWELLTGKAPFTRKTQADIIAAILEHTPPPLAQTLPDAPPELAELASQLLRKDKDERWPSAATLADELKRLKLHDDVGAVNSSGAARATLAMHDDQVARPTQLGVAQLTGTLERMRPWRAVLAVSLLIVALAAGYFVYRWREAQEIDSVAVMPFVNVGNNPDLDYLAEGLTENLINDLAQLPQLKVVSRNSVFRLKAKMTDTPNIPEIARQLGVRAVVTGRIVQRGNFLTIDFGLEDARTGRQLGGGRFQNKPFEEVLALQQVMALDISSKLRAQLSETERKRLAPRQTQDSAAYQLYLQGRFYLNKFNEADINRSLTFFQQAIDKDAQYALAYVGLAQAYRALSSTYRPASEVIPLAQEKVRKALELDSNLAEAYSTLASLQVSYDWDWSAAEQSCQRALKLNPNDVNAHTQMGTLLQSLGRPDDALHYFKHALDLDRLVLASHHNLGRVYNFAGQYVEAIAAYQKSLELEPNFSATYQAIGQIYIFQGKYKLAEEALDRAQALGQPADGPPILAVRGQLYAEMGRKAEAQQLLAQLLASPTFVRPHLIALVYTALGQDDEALIWLEKAVKERSRYASVLNVNPSFARLRTNPRFQDLLKRLGLPLPQKIKLPRTPGPTPYELASRNIA